MTGRGPSSTSLRISGELSDHGRKSNCKDATTEEFGMFEGVQSGEWLEPSKGNLGDGEGRSYFMQGHRRTLAFAGNRSYQKVLSGKAI